MPASSPLSRVDPISLPHVWRVEDLAAQKETVATGYPQLDHVLPGGGWPLGSMVEVLQEIPGQHVWQLLLPALSHALSRCEGPVVLIGSPYQPFFPSLKAQGLLADRFLRVQSDQPKLRMWSAEQALRCAQVAAVLAWLPQSRGDELRRLHLAAQQHERLLFVFRSLKCLQEASPAPLRLLVEGEESLQVRILKRRGPPMDRALTLPASPERLRALLAARRKRSSAGAEANLSTSPGRSHVLDRTSAFA
jgi:protein ImuA